MDKTQEKIIEIFKSKGKELSTGELAFLIYEDYKNLRDKLDKESKRKTAILHRRLLHHLNKLIEKDIVRVYKHGEKGHKFFCLNFLRDNETIEVSGIKRKIVVSSPSVLTVPIECYEQEGIVKKYNNPSWIENLNSLVISCGELKNINELKTIIGKSLGVINDSLCLDGFEKFAKDIEKEDFRKFLEDTCTTFMEYNKSLNFILNVSNFGDIKKENLEAMFKFASETNGKTINFIYNLNLEEIQEFAEIFRKIISFYLRNKKMLYIKNKTIQKGPYFLGKAGPYSFNEREWLEGRKLKCFACSQSSLIIDVEKFNSKYGTNVEMFSQLMMNASKSFLLANAMQRKKAEEYFREIIDLNRPNEKEFLELSRNYIRFWNFGLMQPGVNPELVLNMISEAKKKINEFSLAEETIYKSCGMPIRFRVALSCAFQESEEKLSYAKYKKLEIKSLGDYYNSKIKKEIEAKESITSLFDGGNDVTFHRKGEISEDDIAREISVILSVYKIPLFSFSFQEINANRSINSFA